jgi:dolichol kinase
MIVSLRMRLLGSVHAVARPGWGEIFFPLGIALAALLYLPSNQHLYSLSTLVLAISDPLANIVGNRANGNRGSRLLFGKSLPGSLAFLASSALICVAFLPVPQALLLSSALTITEAVSPLGSDNLTIAAVGTVATLL